jgi:hypothetical protein
MKELLAAVVLAACGAAPPPVRLTADWRACGGDYKATTEAWTRSGTLRGQYQEVLELAATFKSPDWRAAHAAREAENRGLDADGKTKLCAQAEADAKGPYEVELLVTTWDRRENDLDRGQKSVWHVVLVDDTGKEIEPMEIVKDKRPQFTLRAEFPAMGDFAVAYVARFAPEAAVLGPTARALRLRMSSERGGVELAWKPGEK